MRILAVSSRFPPAWLGGYELACKDVMDRLRARGHDVCVLTSVRDDAGASTRPDDEWTRRELDFAPLARSQTECILGRALREQRNHAACRACVSEFRPDVISVWDMWGLLPGLLTTLRRTAVPVTYAISSPWALDYAATPHRWQAFWAPALSGGIKRRIKRVLRGSVGRWLDRTIPIDAAVPDLRQAHFASGALRAAHARAGWDCGDAPVIYHGVDTSLFRPRSVCATTVPNRLLVVGRVVAEKGIHTAIEAVQRLVAEHGGAAPRLDIVGPQPDADYAGVLSRIIVRDGLESHVRLHAPVEHSAMPGVYAAHDVLIFPSIWEEPFALTLLEAMACGLPVVGTTTGGSAEILEHELTGLAFEAGDAGSLCAQIVRLRTEPELGTALAGQARRRVARDFAIEYTVAQVEAFLALHVRGAGATLAAR